MLREHKNQGLVLRFSDPVSSSDISLTYGTGIYVNNTLVEYSVDGTSWTEYWSDDVITIDSNTPFVLFRAAQDNTPQCEEYEGYPFGKFTVSGECKCSGDVMCLLNPDGMAYTAYTNIFRELFRSTDILTAPEISATTLMHGCYEEMFMACDHLETPMASLPAETLAENCYKGMFYGCKSMTRTPELMFGDTAYGSCESMFRDCPHIAKVTLRNTELSENCFRYMFKNCSALNYIKCKFIVWPEYRNQYHTEDDAPRDNATFDWTEGVAESGTFIRDFRLPLYINDKPAVTPAAIDTTDGEPYNWDLINNIPIDTTDRFNWDPWVGKDSQNLTDIPACSTRYQTIANDKDSFTATFTFLSSIAVTGTKAASLETTESDFYKTFDWTNIESPNSHADPGHAGSVNIDELFMEEFGLSAEDIFITPDHDVFIYWGDGAITRIPKYSRVDPGAVFAQGTSGNIGGIFRHTYEPGGPYIITVVSADITPDDSFYEVVTVNYDGDGPKYEYKGCMPPLYAGDGSNIAKLLTPLLPIYQGARNHGRYYPIPCMFYGNTDFISVPTADDNDPSGSSPLGFMFAKNKQSLDHPFGAARMFEGCSNLSVMPSMYTLSINQQNPAESAIVPAITRNSGFEGFMKGTAILSAQMPNIELKPFIFAELFSGCTHLNKITCSFDHWFSNYDQIDPAATDLAATLFWTKSVDGEYTPDGTFVNMNQDVVARRSISADSEHEYNPWSPNGIRDNEFITFTNTSGSTQTITLKNQRRLFASKVSQNSDERTLDLKKDSGNTETVKCHVHLLQYRKKTTSQSWSEVDWCDITDDVISGTTINNSNEPGHNTPSTLTSESEYDFVWSIQIENNMMVQLRGVPCEYGSFQWAEYNNVIYPSPTSQQMNWYKFSLKFDNYNYMEAGGEAAYWYTCPQANFEGTSRPASVASLSGGGTGLMPLWKTAQYTNFSDNTIHTGDIYTGPFKIWRGKRMETAVNTSTQYYQFFNCNSLEVTGFIDTFFDWLDYKHTGFSTPPYAYYRLFSGTGILTAPNIYATKGVDRAEFAECFMGCSNLSAPAKMNVSDIPMAAPLEGPAKQLRYNYNTMQVLPSGIIVDPSSVMTNGMGSAVSSVGSNLQTYYWEQIGGGDCIIGDNWHYGAFERMYKDCTSLVWPMAYGYPEQLSVVHVNGSGRGYSRGRTFKEMFMNCTSIGSFGLVVFGKYDDSFNQNKASNLKYHAMQRMFKNCTTGNNYLWNCFYTVASLKHYTKFGNRDGVLASWEGGGPTSYWLDDTNVAMLTTNCANRANDNQDPWKVSSVSRGVSHCGTCSNNAYDAAYNDHHNEYAAYMTPTPKQTWVRFHESYTFNDKMLTWRTGDGSTLTV